MAGYYLLKDTKCYYPGCKESILFPMTTCATCGVNHWCPSMCNDHYRSHGPNYIKCPTITYHSGHFVDKNCEDIIHDKHAIEYFPGGVFVAYLWTIEDYVLKYHFKLGQVCKGKLLLNDNVFLRCEESLDLDKFKDRKN
jgi:hypothetical protein